MQYAYDAAGRALEYTYDLAGRVATRRSARNLVAAGVSESDVLADYPDIEADGIKASLEYAAAQLGHRVLVARR